MDNNIVRKLPPRGTCEDILKRLYEYINPVDKYWIEKIKPASKEKIDKLIKLSQIETLGLNFPKEYIAFLENMGGSEKNFLDWYLMRDTNIDKVLEIYQYIEEDRENGIEDEDFCEKKFLFAYDDINEECYIKMFENGTHKIIGGLTEMYKTDYLYDNFEKMLFYAAFSEYEQRYFRKKIHLVSDKEIFKSLNIEEILPSIEEVLKNNGFQKVWFGDKYHFIMVKKDITISIKNMYSPCTYIYGNDEIEMEYISDKLCDFLSAKVMN